MVYTITNDALRIGRIGRIDARGARRGAPRTCGSAA